MHATGKPEYMEVVYTVQSVRRGECRLPFDRNQMEMDELDLRKNEK